MRDDDYYLQDHYRPSLPDFHFPAGLSHAGAGGAFFAAGFIGAMLVEAPLVVTASGLFEVFSVIGGIASGSVLLGVGGAELLGRRTLSSENIELLKTLGNPAFAGVLGLGALSGDSETLNRISNKLNALDLAATLSEARDASEFLERLESLLKIVGEYFLKTSPADSHEDTGEPAVSKDPSGRDASSANDPVRNGIGNDFGYRDFSDSQIG
jgi:hypothetical protein